MQALNANTTASNNTAVGYQAGYSNTTGTNMVAVGYKALYASTATSNTAVGTQALQDNTSGAENSAFGTGALAYNITGYYNTAVGSNSLVNNNASDNTGVGYQAGYSNTTGSANTSVGRGSGFSTTTGANNIALGYLSLANNTTASQSTAVGSQSGYSNTTGHSAAFFGRMAGYSNTTGIQNTFIGEQSGYYVTTGQKNTILGRYSGNQGGLDIRTSNNNIVLSDGDGNPRGYYHGGLTSPLWIFETPTTGQNSMHIKNSTTGTPYGIASQFTGASPNNTSQYFYVAYDAPASSTKFVVYSNGNVANVNNSYGAISDVKLKENIVDSGSQWDDIKALRVRKYSMKSDNLDAPNQLGVIAQELEDAGMNGLVFETPDQDFDTKEDLGTVTKQVNYSILYMKAVKALQEAMDRIETLEADVAALKNP
jgi:hypothetical protein